MTNKQKIDYIHHNILNDNEIEEVVGSDKELWKFVSFFQHMNEPFIHKHRIDVDWTYVSTRQEYSEEFIRNHIKYFQLELYLSKFKIKEDFARELSPYMTKGGWFNFFMYNTYSLEFMREFLPKAINNSYAITTNRDFTEKELLEIKDWVEWRRIHSYCITEKLMDRFAEEINWYDLSKERTFANTEADKNFIRKYQAYLFFPNIDMSIYDKEFRDEIRKMINHREELHEKFQSFL